MMRKSDARMKLDVETELDWDPDVDSAEIGVTVEGGVVTLLGGTDSYAERWAAEKAARRVAGVGAVNVEHGFVTLEDQVHWRFQRDAAELSVRGLKGVVALFDNIALRPKRERDPGDQDPASVP